MACLRTVLTLTLLCWACCRAERPRCPRDAEPRCVYVGFDPYHRYQYTVDGLNVTVEFYYDIYFKITCPEGLTLDNSALPRFESQQRVDHTYLWNCPAPRDSYAGALGKLNVVVLKKLSIIDAGDVTVAHLAGLSGLRELDLWYNSTNLLPGVLAALPALRDLHVSHWEEQRPAPWAECAALESLELSFAAAVELPAGWLQHCGQLRKLRVESARHLSQLDAELLRGARNLEKLSFKRCALTSLPAGLLDDAVKLRRLNLHGNSLHELPGGLFAMTRSLQELVLAFNDLTPAVFGSLQSVTSLTKLDLSYNRHLKDSCGGNVSETVPGLSPLLHLTQLTELNLRFTGASKICRDWRESMSLEKLNLKNNAFTFISYAELQFSHQVEVNLSGNNITTLEYTRADYELVRQGETSSARVQLDVNTFSCDCGSYWAVRALRERPDHLQPGRELLAQCTRIHGNNESTFWEHCF